MDDNTEDQNALVTIAEPQVYEGEIVDDDNLRRECVFKIGASWQKSIDAIFETGRLLIEARLVIEHGKFNEMIDEDLPFNNATARKLIKIAEDQRLLSLAKPEQALLAPDNQMARQEYVRRLPSSWTVLYELTQLNDEQFKVAVEEGKIHSMLGHKDAIHLKRIPTGRADLNVRQVNQPPRKDKPDTTTAWDVTSIGACETVGLAPAEVLILDILYKEAVQFGKVQGWVDQNWPTNGEKKLEIAPLDIEKLGAKLAATMKKFGL